jgi:elongation factor Ts
MTITANQVKDLRERTGLGMMECKQALTETNGDMEAAIELLRKKAGSKVEKKAGRTAAEGAVGTYLSPDRKLGAIVEINSETDFVAKGEDFQAFANQVAEAVARNNPADIEAVSSLTLANGQTVAKTREALVAKLGENISVRRFVRFAASQGHVSAYVHGRKIGVMLEHVGGDESLGRDMAMHIAASRPEFVSSQEVPAAQIEKEREIFRAQAAESGKPANIIEKMIEGRVNKYLAEITLLGQPFVKDQDSTVEKVLKGAGATVAIFQRFEVGEGIEKKSNDFAAEVMAQVKGG